MKPNLLIDIIFQKSYPDRVLFRVDAGNVPGLSFGHLARCMVLARHLAAHGTRSTLLMQDFSEGLRHAQENGMDVVPMPLGLNEKHQADFLARQIDILGPAWVVLDIPYDTDFDSLCIKIRQKNCRLLFIDDARFITPPVDVLLNSSILALEKTRPSRSSRTQFLLGPKYFIFDPPPRRQVAGRPFFSDILLCFGGSDPTGLSLKVIQTLPDTELRSQKVILIAGPGFKERARVDHTVQKLNLNIGIVENPEDIYPYFTGAGLVICAGGRTVYELMELGVAAFPIASIGHETAAVNALLEAKKLELGMAHWDAKIFIERLNHWLQRHY